MLGCKEATGIDVVYDVSIKGAQVSIEALTTLSDQITVLLRLPKPAASRRRQPSSFSLPSCSTCCHSSMVKRTDPI